MSNVKDLILRLLVQDKMSPALKKAGDSAATTEKKTEKLNNSVKTLKASYIAAAAAIAGTVLVIKKLLSAYAQQELAEKKLAGALRATGQYSKETLDDLTRFASGIQQVTIYGDEAVLKLSQLAISMGLSADQSKVAVKGAIGLATAFGIDANTAIRGVTLALQGEFTLLNRYIPALRQVNTEEEKRAVLMKTLSEGFSLAMEETSTYTGAVQQASNQFGDALEKLGGALAVAVLPIVKEATVALQDINKALEGATGWVDKLNKKFETASPLFQKVLVYFKTAIDDMTHMRLAGQTMLFNILGIEDGLKKFFKTGETGGKGAIGTFGEMTLVIRQGADAVKELNTGISEFANMSTVDVAIGAEAVKDLTRQIEEETIRQREIMEANYRAVADTFTGAFESAFSQWIKGAENLGKALEKALLDALASIVAKYIASQVFNTLLSFVGGPTGFLAQLLGTAATSAPAGFSAAPGSPQPVINIQTYQASPFATSSDEMAKDLIYTLENKMDLQGRFKL